MSVAISIMLCPLSIINMEREQIALN